MKQHTLKILRSLKVGQSVAINSNDENMVIVWEASEMALRFGGHDIRIGSDGINIIVSRIS